MTLSLDEALGWVAEATEPGPEQLSVGLVGNAADVFPRAFAAPISRRLACLSRTS